MSRNISNVDPVFRKDPYGKIHFGLIPNSCTHSGPTNGTTSLRNTLYPAPVRCNPSTKRALNPGLSPFSSVPILGDVSNCSIRMVEGEGQDRSLGSHEMMYDNQR